MKKIGLITIVLLLAANLCACGRKAEPTPTEPQTNTQPAATVPATMPEIDPTLDTNIPDPTVNENSQGMGMDDSSDDSIGSTNGTENSDIGTDNNQNGLDNSSRSRMFR